MSESIRLLGCSSSMESGGSERQMLNLLSYLDRSRWKPSLYLLYRKGPLLEEVPRDIDIHDFWSKHSKPVFNWPGRMHCRQVEDLCQTIRHQRIQIIYDRLYHMALIAGTAARRTGAKRVATIVSPPAHDLLAGEQRFVWLKRKVLAHSYRSADRLIAVSHGTADEAAHFYRIDRSRIEVLPNPIDLERVDRLIGQSWRGLPLRANAKAIVSIGRLSDEKGHRFLLEAMAILGKSGDQAIDLHLVGDGPRRELLEQQAATLGLGQRVVFHGHVANPFPLLAQADLFVLPSLYEGLPNALLEAMACKIPTIVSNCPGGIQQATQNGKLSCLVPIGDAPALSHAIQQSLENHGENREKLDKARRHVEQQHSLKPWMDRMETIFAQTLTAR